MGRLREHVEGEMLKQLQGPQERYYGSFPFCKIKEMRNFRVCIDVLVCVYICVYGNYMWLLINIIIILLYMWCGV